MLSTSWPYVAACLVVPIAWGAVVHVIFERIGARRRSAGRHGAKADGGGAPVEPDDDLAPEYQI
jgi:hypothetical protein